MNYRDSKALMLQQARAGQLGTPENPQRGNTYRECFWAGFFGYRKPQEYPNGSAVKACVAAGAAWGKELGHE